MSVWERAGWTTLITIGALFAAALGALMLMLLIDVVFHILMWASHSWWGMVLLFVPFLWVTIFRSTKSWAE